MHRPPTQVQILLVLLVLSSLCIAAGSLAQPAAAVNHPVFRVKPGNLRQEETFSGQALRFSLPAGFQPLEADNGGCFVYHEAMPGFLVLYRTIAPPGETLAGLLAATTNVRQIETPLEVDVDGLTFTGLFVETVEGSRLFLAAAEGWGLVAQGAIEDWPSLAAGLNQVLRTLTFVEE